MKEKAHSIIKKGLEQLRNKLLDISGRNPLISFRHSDRSKGLIQAIHTPLEVIFTALKEEKDVQFKSLPEPILQLPNSDIGTNQVVSGHITPKEHAASLGLNTSYDLQLTYDGVSDELAIQTMLFPDKFLKKMTGFLDVQKQYIEETGINCMHACFGFLEWYESASSKHAIISPLLMIPVYVERQYKRQQSVFQLNSTGDEIRGNPALNEKLKKNFGLQLPSVTEVTTVKEYFSELNKIIKDQPRWKIQQRLTIGRVSFAKILMYYDLDPNTWPTDDSILDQPLVQDLFVGPETVQPAGFAVDDHLDETDQASLVPLVISDLDSSQLSAVADAMCGKSFVIEGPPGTGKSQTITNIIAAAMADGKSVLFVAEKLVALQVVKNRLDAAGLGHFCLELHATKIQKGKFYEELKTRLELKDESADKLTKKLAAMIIDHRELKSQLNLYASTMGMSFGVTDRTLHDYFWLYHERKDKLPREFVEEAESFYLKNVFRMSETELLKLNEYAANWISHNQEILIEFGGVKKHPWYGLQAKFNGYSEIKGMLHLINQLISSLHSLKDLADGLGLYGQDVSNLSDLVQLMDQLQNLSSCLQDSKACDSKVFARIRDQNDVDFLLSFLRQKQSINNLADALRASVEISDCQNIKGLQELIDHLNVLWAGAVREGLQEWTPFQINAVSQAEQLKELSADSVNTGFIKTIQAFQEIQQKWHVYEEKCKALVSAESCIDLDLINRLKRLQELVKAGGFEFVHHSRWKELLDVIRDFLTNDGESSTLGFDELLLGLPQHLIEQKKIADELSRYIELQKAFSECFPRKFDIFLTEVQAFKDSQFTLSDLDFFRSEKMTLKENKQRYRKHHFDIIHFVVPQWTDRLSIKVLKSLCEVYLCLASTPRDVLRIRSPAVCDEVNYNNLLDAVVKYDMLRKKRLDLESRFNLDIDMSILRQSISALRNSGMFSWFKKEVRNAKKIFREFSVGNINASLGEMLSLFEQVQSYKNEHLQFHQEPRFAVFLNELGMVGESRLGVFRELLDWSAQINQHLRGNDFLLLTMKNFIFESSLSQLDSFIHTFEDLDLEKCLEALSVNSQLPFLDDQIEILNKELEELDRLRTAAIEVGYQQGILFKRAEDVHKLYCRWAEGRMQIKSGTQKLYERVELLESAIGLYEKIGLQTTSEVLSISDFIELLEECEVLREETKKQEDMLMSRKCQIQRFRELLREPLLNSNISFQEINHIIEKLQVLQEAVSNLPCSDIFSTVFDSPDLFTLDEIHNACQFYLYLTGKGITQSLIRYVQNGSLESRKREIQIHLSHLQQILPQALKELECVIKDGEINSKIWFENTNVLMSPFADVISKLENVYSMRGHLQGWVQFKNLEDKLAQCGIKALCQLFLRKKMDPDLISIAIEFVFYQSIIVTIQQEHSILNQVDYHDVNSLRQRFTEIDQQLIGLYRKLAAAKIMERTIDPGTKRGSRREWTGKALIELEVAKQRKHRPIRELLQNAGEAMQSLKPCFMMSPLSVVQYLAPGNLTFDLIIIDEASQVKPEDAIGTLARGKQIIVVGDPKQLPPTDFWKNGGDCEEDEDENEDIGNEESILDLAATIYQPMRRLRWHYRSQHESLINFSNHEFYDNNLIIFPSPNFSDSKLGLSYKFVEDAQYLRGGDKINHEEASQLVNAVEIFMRDHPDRSVGIVTMNVPQRELINDMMNLRFSESAIIEGYRTKWSDTLEPFFVKNLENVQGDERDVIFISTLYGKEKLSASEKLNQNFGPINKANGHRRLNVLFTRAKQQIVIFSSLDPDEIRITEESPRGLRVLKGYLKYAKSGNLSFDRVTDRDYGSDFERSVAKYIKDWGYEVDSQVGVGGYFLDLAVIHPHKPGKHMLAIECDGATYHSSRSARDRDRLRQQALERMGWSIHRIWSTDWFKNQRAQLKQLKSILLLKSEEL